MNFKSCWDHEGMAQSVLKSSGQSSHLHCTHAWKMVEDWQREEWLLDIGKNKREEAVRVYSAMVRGDVRSQITLNMIHEYRILSISGL